MRDIKFRAWDQEHNKMIYDLRLSTLGFYGDDLNFSLNQTNLMQYTGLKDENGKEIYEGDIVQTKGRYRGGVSGVVEYDPDRAKFVLKTSKVAGSVDEFGDSDLDWEYYKIIGNIHENPELLKK